VRELALLEPPYRLALVIFRGSMRTFAAGDHGLARTLKLKDRDLDAITRDLSEKLVARATVDSELVPSYLDLIFVARALERIGITGSISRRIPSGATKPLTFVTLTDQRKKINRHLSMRAPARAGGCPIAPKTKKATRFLSGFLALPGVADVDLLLLQGARTAGFSHRSPP
jgi:hypothetical protein